MKTTAGAPTGAVISGEAAAQSGRHGGLHGPDMHSAVVVRSYGSSAPQVSSSRQRTWPVRGASGPRISVHVYEQLNGAVSGRGAFLRVRMLCLQGAGAGLAGGPNSSSGSNC